MLLREALIFPGVSPEEFDFVVVNSSLFNPDPSHSSIVKEHFKLRSDVHCFDLGGRHLYLLACISLS